MAETRKVKHVMYNAEASGSGQSQASQSTPTQTVTIQQQQPRAVIYSKQMPAVVQQEMQQQNVRIIYAQPPPMQVQMQMPGDPNVRTAYVLSNQQGSEATLKQERDGQMTEQNVRIIYAPQQQQLVQMQVQDPNTRRITHLNPVTLQVNADGTIVNRTEPLMCEVDLRQYQQLQVVQQQPLPEENSHPQRTTTIMQAGQQYVQELHQMDQSQQTSGAGAAFSMKKKEKVLLPCMQCRDSFRTQCQLQAHIRNKHVKPFKCDSCWKAFSFESQLKLHVTTHTGEKPYKCDVCPKAYARKTALFNHVRVHARKKFFKCCKYCGKGFKNEDKLEKHERQHSMSDDRKYITLEMLVDKPV